MNLVELTEVMMLGKLESDVESLGNEVNSVELDKPHNNLTAEDFSNTGFKSGSDSTDAPMVESVVDKLPVAEPVSKTAVVEPIRSAQSRQPVKSYVPV